MPRDAVSRTENVRTVGKKKLLMMPRKRQFSRIAVRLIGVVFPVWINLPGGQKYFTIRVEINSKVYYGNISRQP